MFSHPSVLSWTHSQEGATISFYVDVTSASGMGSKVQLTGKSRPLLGWVGDILFVLT